MSSRLPTALLTEELIASLRRGQEQADALRHSILVSVAQPVPHEYAPQAAFAAGRRPSTYRLFWAQPSKEFWLVGLGSAITLAANGSRPLDAVKRRCRSLFKTAIVSEPGIRGIGPLFLGGFRFDPAAPRSSAWRDFSDALLVLPRLLLTFSNGDHWLTMNGFMQPGGDWRSEADALSSELETLAAYSPTDAAPLEPISKGISQSQSSHTEWAHSVQQALQAIEAGQLFKVVLARKMGLSFEGGFVLERALDELCRSYPECTVFALCAGSSTFLGATPEVLVHLEHGSLRLSCLAGSIARGATPAEDQQFAKELLQSAKDQREHAPVVTEVARALDGVCQEVRWDARPHVVKLRTVQHLATSFSGHLNGRPHILDLVKLLHPTPAVGGVPTRKALEVIRRLEGDRGWYAAPVGWLDRHGDGEFSVAIRSALLQNNQATLFAGSGIVQGSDPDLELEETNLKFQPMLAALVEG